MVDKAHAQLSASGSERWMNCPASIAHCKDIPDEPSSPYAQEGTEAHECVEKLLLSIQNFGAQAAVNTLKGKYPEEMVDHALRAATYIVSKARKGSLLMAEQKVSLEHIAPGMFGTLDAAIVDEFNRLWVFDFKYGQGLVVSPEENSQLIYYALALAHKYHYNFTDVCLSIIQPRTDDDRGPIREWVIPIEALEVWEDKFKVAVERTEDPLAEYRSGDWCRWCKGKATCPELSNKSFHQAQIDFEPNSALPVFREPDELKARGLSNTLKAIEKIEMWAAAVKARAFQLMERGEHIDGFKLVEKRSIRKWNDPRRAEKAAYHIYGDAIFTKELKSPAQLEKIHPDAKKFVEKNTTSLSSGLTMVGENDPRPAVARADSDFGNMDADAFYEKVAKSVFKKLKTKTGPGARKTKTKISRKGKKNGKR